MKFYVEQIATVHDLNSDIFYSNKPFDSVNAAKDFVLPHTEPHLEYNVYQCENDVLTLIETKVYGDMWKPVEETE